MFQKSLLPRKQQCRWNSISWHELRQLAKKNSFQVHYFGFSKLYGELFYKVMNIFVGTLWNCRDQLCKSAFLNLWLTVFAFDTSSSLPPSPPPLRDLFLHSKVYALRWVQHPVYSKLRFCLATVTKSPCFVIWFTSGSGSALKNCLARFNMEAQRAGRAYPRCSVVLGARCSVHGARLCSVYDVARCET